MTRSQLIKKGELPKRMRVEMIGLANAGVLEQLQRGTSFAGALV